MIWLTSVVRLWVLWWEWFYRNNIGLMFGERFSGLKIEYSLDYFLIMRFQSLFYAP
jgi:hypothetical protein